MSTARNNWKVRRAKKEQQDGIDLKDRFYLEYKNIEKERENMKLGIGIWEYIQIQNKKNENNI